MTTLVDHFRSLGVDDPEGWASSQEEEGIDQLARATLLRALADEVAAAPGLWAAQTGPDSTPEVRAAAERLAASGADPQDIDLVLTATAWELVFGVLSLLDGASEPALNPGDVGAGIFALDDAYEPTGAPLALHESWRDVAGTILGPKVLSR